MLELLKWSKRWYVHDYPQSLRYQQLTTSPTAPVPCMTPFEHIWIQCPTDKHHNHSAAVCKQGLRGQIGDYFSGLAQKKHTWARRANTITSGIFMQQRNVPPQVKHKKADRNDMFQFQYVWSKKLFGHLLKHLLFQAAKVIKPGTKRHRISRDLAWFNDARRNRNAAVGLIGGDM